MRLQDFVALVRDWHELRIHAVPASRLSPPVVRGLASRRIHAACGGLQ
jgi:hypothetical protein